MINIANKYSFGKHTNKSVEILLNHLGVNANQLFFIDMNERYEFANEYATKIAEWQRKFHEPNREQIFYAIMYYIRFK